MSGRRLTVAEQKVWESFPTGRTLTTSHSPTRRPAPNPDTVMRAEVMARLLLGECKPTPGHIPALRLRGAAMAGELDFSVCGVPRSVVKVSRSRQRRCEGGGFWWNRAVALPCL